MTIPAPAAPQQPTEPTEPTERHAFLHRVIRFVALIALAYSAVHLLHSLLYYLIEGISWRYARDPYRWWERAFQLTGVGMMLLLLTGALGMLQSKPWARHAVMLWAVLTIILGFVSSLPWLLQYADDVSAATTRSIYRPVWQQGLWQLLGSISESFFPLLIWLIMRRPEVAAHFTHPRSGGFEVVPFAKTANKQITPPAS